VKALLAPRTGGLLALAVIIALLPAVLPNNFYFNVAILVGLNAIVCIGLNLLIGYAGQISLGHAGAVMDGLRSPRSSPVRPLSARSHSCSPGRS
jgi:hypothetical protein